MIAFLALLLVASAIGLVAQHARIKRLELDNASCPKCIEYRKLAVHWCSKTLELDRRVEHECYERNMLRDLFSRGLN